MFKRVYILYAGGHSKQCIDIFLENGFNILGIFDDKYDGQEIDFYRNTKIIGKINDLDKYLQKCNEYLFCTIGDNNLRYKTIEMYPPPKYNYINCISKSAYISDGSRHNIGIGNYIGAFSEISSDSYVGSFNILNDKSQVMHDNKIGDFNHISCNTTLCGNVSVGNYCFIGASALVNNKIKICDNVTVGSNSTVIRDITDPGTYVGTPTRKIP